MSLKKENGLINTSILAAMEDRNGNIWVSTESGIDFIEYKSPFRFLFPDIPYNGTGYSMALFRDRLYLGTNNGLYYTEMLQDRSGPAVFREVADSKDICWDLDVIDDNLWLGHNEGASIVADDHLLPAFRGKGVWRFIKQDSQNIIFGSYEGFGMITQEGQQYVASILPGFDESSRIVLIDSSFNIWMSHPYRGVYKLKKPHMGSPFPSVNTVCPGALSPTMKIISLKRITVYMHPTTKEFLSTTRRGINSGATRPSKALSDTIREQSSSPLMNIKIFGLERV